MTDPQTEALELLGQIVNELTLPIKNLKSILRKCQHVCELMGWVSTRNWFHQELTGLYAGRPLPDYRKINGILVWEPAEENDIIDWTSSGMVYGCEPEDVVTESVTLDYYGGIDWLLAAGVSGYTEKTQETKMGTIRPRGRKIQLKREKRFLPGAFLNAIAYIENRTFDFASKTYVQIRYGDAMGKTWDIVRSAVVKKMGEIGFSKSLDAITEGLTSDNPEALRNMVFGCRNIVKDLADLLWQDTRDYYDYLPGTNKKEKLKVTSDKTKNRIKAYLHQKGFSGTRGEYYASEMDRLGISFDSLIARQATAHSRIEATEARLIALSTFLLVGELVMNTDMIPVTEYVGQPAPGIQK
ncbi:MAG: hypothetical protein WEA61_10640 [Anaerolineales bacterium]